MESIIQDVKSGGIVSAYIKAPFDEGKEELEKNGYKIISLEQNAKLRMQEGRGAFVSQNGNWVREGVLYVPNKGIFLTKNSPIMENAKEATNIERNRTGYLKKENEFRLTEEQVEKALEDSIEICDEPIPTNRFGDEMTIYAFGNSAKDYGLFLREGGIMEFIPFIQDIENPPYARQVRFCELGKNFKSCMDSTGFIRKLSYCDIVRGVREDSKSGSGIEKILKQ
ncbi:MAG: hypothetical protein WC475_03960 [Candidatus Paceibacterota bacterium]